MSRLKLLFLGLLSGMVFAATSYAAENTPVGYWKTIDDATGKPKSIVQIWKVDDQALMGKVVKIFPKQGETQNKLCAACKGDLHNQPIVGMVIISGLKASKSEWDNGKILDPENGKLYSCSIKLGDRGKKLSVHGYIGIPIIGRSQIWERVDLMSEG